MIPIEKTIHHQFERIVEQYPQHIAFSETNYEITYNNLNSKANQIANYIVSQFPDEKLIVVYSDQGIEHVATMLAVSKTGKTLIPLNSMMPVRTVDEIMAQYGANTILTDSTHIEELKKHTHQLVDVPHLEFKETPNLNLEVDPNSEFIIFNTSGSTGVPKGVVHSHQRMLINIQMYINLYELTSKDVHSLVYATGFYGGIRDTLISLLGGSKLSYFDRDNNIKTMQQWINSEKITIFSTPIKLYRDLIHSATDEGFDSIRLFRPGGDTSYQKDFYNFKKFFPVDAKYMLLFASSETGIVLHNTFTHNYEPEDEVLPLGKPVKGVNVYVMDDNSNRIEEDGVEGTIVIENEHQFIGYKNLPEITKESLQGNKFISSDLGKIIDGCVYFTGRKQHHVKISGARVDINAITARVMHLDSVQNAVTIFHSEKKNLYLFYETHQNVIVTENKIKSYLLKHLPYYMVPARCIYLDRLPISQNGKIKRKELAESIDTLEQVTTSTKLTRVQKILTEIWVTNLEFKIDKVGLDDNFFDTLGGDSITAAAIVVDIEERLTLTLKDHALYEYSTIRALSEAIEKNAFQYFKWIKKIIDGDSDKTPIFWFTGWPNVIKKEINYQGQVYYADSHYNHFTDIPELNLTIEKFCQHIVDEMMKTTTLTKVILGGYSLGAVHALEIAKQLKDRNIDTETIFLLDPRDTIVRFKDQISMSKTNTNLFYNNLMYRLSNIVLYSRYYFFKASWHILKLRDSKIFKRQKFIHSIYACHRMQYSFQPYSGKVIMIQRESNTSKTAFNWKHLFNPKKLTIYTSKYLKHSDFFANQDTVKEWTQLFNRHINN